MIQLKQVSKNFQRQQVLDRLDLSSWLFASVRCLSCNVFFCGLGIRCSGLARSVQ